MTYLLSRNSKLCSLSMIKTSLHVEEVLLLLGWLLYKISNIIAGTHNPQLQQTEPLAVVEYYA